VETIAFDALHISIVSVKKNGNIAFQKQKEALEEKK